ncbi:TPA: hypothetical protein ACOTGY_001364 [Clostridium perfringens]|uniref:hypothetical protein n=1 Tax=Clostridium perfringens TaxID=1502 RepID=UPI001ABADA09|nr:hypothetical protein [Clostridium perfringens]MBO3421694.1 hypothetical protein [Clostridium perfringens]MCX0399585.1 hypothetical protein [Clostridium perfringens]MDK0673865.1 hypothetical protein [Clostridium perfringens]MDK0673915.1 hypothetical protein [Clostridium perfringens]MDK0738842.1 hypothetical protein [Clostridium perfringens]
MAKYVSVSVVCPCGRLLETRRCNAESNSTTKGSKKCPSCKKKVAYQITRGRAYTSYE